MTKLCDPQIINGVTWCKVHEVESVPRRQFVYKPPQLEIVPVYIDERIIVVDKPADLLTVPGKDAALGDCLEARLRKAHGNIGVVHRLDHATSGLMVFARDAQAHRHIGRQFERRQVKKQYVARVWGRPLAVHGAISLPMRCDWPNRPLQMVDYEYGRQAETGFEVIANEGHCYGGQGENATSLLRLFPLSGRSHQLRLHLAEIGHPILGDSFYAADAVYRAAPRLLLHAARLEFYHPEGGQWLHFDSKPDF